MVNKPSFHIFGANGLLGSALASRCREKGFEVRAYSRSSPESIRLDLSSFDISLLVNEIRSKDIVVNLAAVAQPMAVFNNIKYSRLINVGGNKKLHDVAAIAGCKYFFMSSVEVFDGTEQIVFEDTPKKPINEYGRQKAEAEDYIIGSGYNNYVIGRTSWNVSSTNRGRCLVPFMINALQEDGAKMAVDNIFTIALASETADVIISSLLTDYTGIVHIASPEPISRYRIAEIIIENYSSVRLNCQPCRFEEIVFREPRSKLNILDVSTSMNKLHASYSSPEEILLKRIRELDKY